jgi:hypothetical protein
MEFYSCNKQDKDYLNISLFIIYIICISILIFYIKQPDEVIKEENIELLINDEDKLLFFNYNTQEKELELQAVYEDRAIIAIKKYGDAYKKYCNAGECWKQENNFNIINSEEHTNLINKNDICRCNHNSDDNFKYNFINNLFREEYINNCYEQLVIVRKEALNAMKKANLYSNLFEKLKRFQHSDYSYYSGQLL